MIITIDEQQQIVLFNGAAERMFKYEARDVMGLPLYKLLPQRFHPVHADHVRKFGETGATMRRMGALTPISGLRSNGSEFPIEASISQVKTHSGHFFTVIMRDITERQKTEDRLVGIANNATEAILVTDRHGQVTFSNPEAERLFGLTADKIRGKALHNLIHHACPNGKEPGGQCPLERTRLYGETVRNRENELVRKDGSVLTLELLSSPLVIGGESAGIILVARDATSRVIARQDVDRSYQQMRELSATAHQALEQER